MADCLNCGHPRESHCHCGSACLHMIKPVEGRPGHFISCGSCPRFRDENGLAPCRICESAQHLVKIEIRDGRFTYRCVECHPVV